MATPSPPKSELSTSSYSALKRRVHSLKEQAKKVKSSNIVVKEVETVALLEQKQKYETTIEKLEEEAEELKTMLKQNTERSAKLRAVLEKEKRVAEAQADKLTKALEMRDAESASALSKLEAKHLSEVQRLEATINELKKSHEADLSKARRGYEKARDEILQETDDWCKGEIDAVRFQASQRMDKAMAELNAERAQCEEADAKNKDLQQQLDDERNQSMDLRDQLEHLQSTLSGAEATARALAHGFEEERKEWRAKLDHANRLLPEETKALKASHRSQLELVDTRLKQVVDKKDSAILSLRQELQQVQNRLRKFENLALSPDGEMLECDGVELSINPSPRFGFRNSTEKKQQLNGIPRGSTGCGGILPSFRSSLSTPSVLQSRGFSARV